MAEKEKPAIIQLIVEMVQKGANEEEITSTLLEMGVNPEEAKKLLLFAQKDMYTLVKSEISSITQQIVDAKSEKMKEDIQSVVGKEVTVKSEKKIEDVRNEMENKLKAFEDTINKNASRVDAVETILAKVRTDLAASALIRRTIEMRILSVLLMITGLLLLGYVVFWIISTIATNPASLEQIFTSLFLNVIISIIGAIILAAGVYIREQ